MVVPSPVPDYVTSRVLTMEFVCGRKVTSLGPFARMDLDGAPLSEALCRAYLKQILVDGFFHADPHPGNVFVTQDGRIALLDLGMVGRIAPSMQESLLKLLLAISEGRGEDAAELAIRIGEPLPTSTKPGRAASLPRWSSPTRISVSRTSRSAAPCSSASVSTAASACRAS